MHNYFQERGAGARTREEERGRRTLTRQTAFTGPARITEQTFIDSAEQGACTFKSAICGKQQECTVCERAPAGAVP